MKMKGYKITMCRFKEDGAVMKKTVEATFQWNSINHRWIAHRWNSFRENVFETTLSPEKWLKHDKDGMRNVSPGWFMSVKLRG